MAFNDDDIHTIEYWTSLIPIYTENVNIAENHVKDSMTT